MPRPVSEELNTSASPENGSRKQSKSAVSDKTKMKAHPQPPRDSEQYPYPNPLATKKAKRKRIVHPSLTSSSAPCTTHDVHTPCTGSDHLSSTTRARCTRRTDMPRRELLTVRPSRRRVQQHRRGRHLRRRRFARRVMGLGRLLGTW